MNEIFYALLGACVVGAALLSVNLKVKLPKKLFAFMAVLILVLMFALVMEDREGVPEARKISVLAEGVSDKASEIFSGTFRAGQGNNDFPVGAALSRSGLRGTEYVFEFAAETSPETAADLDCELLDADGRVLKCSGLVFSRGVLKCVFVFPEDFDPRKATTLRLVCGNGSAPTLRRITEREI